MNNLIENDVLNEYNNLVKNDNLLPIKISEFYMKKVVDEVNHIGVGGPLYKSVIPTRQKISIKTSVETRDYVEEDKHLPIVGVDYIIQKYSVELCKKINKGGKICHIIMLMIVLKQKKV